MPLQGQAKVLALAKRVLRRKDQKSILDATYNRYAFHECVPGSQRVLAADLWPCWELQLRRKHLFCWHVAALPSDDGAPPPRVGGSSFMRPPTSPFPPAAPWPG